MQKTMKKAAISAAHSIVTNFTTRDFLTYVDQQKTVILRIDCKVYSQEFNDKTYYVYLLSNL